MTKGRDLRDSFQRVAAQVESDVTRHLHQTVRLGRRRTLRRRTMRIAAVTTTIVLLVTAGPATLRWINERDRNTPGQTSTTTPGVTASETAIAGTYTTVLQDRPGVIRQEEMAGGWILRLESDGVLLLTGPPSFSAILTGIVFDVAGDQFRTNAFLNDLCHGSELGLYRWARAGATLTFTLVADPCATRRELFTAHTWRETSGP